MQHFYKVILSNMSCDFCLQLFSMLASTWRTVLWHHTLHCFWAVCARGAL